MALADKITGWSKPGAASDLLRWNLDAKKGWMPPGQAGPTSNRQYNMPSAWNPSSAPDYSIHVSPPGSSEQAPTDQWNYTKETGLWSPPGTAVSPEDHRNFTQITPIPLPKAPDPAYSGYVLDNADIRPEDVAARILGTSTPVGTGADFDPTQFIRDRWGESWQQISNPQSAIDPVLGALGVASIPFEPISAAMRYGTGALINAGDALTGEPTADWDPEAILAKYDERVPTLGKFALEMLTPVPPAAKLAKLGTVGKIASAALDPLGSAASMGRTGKARQWLGLTDETIVPNAGETAQMNRVAAQGGRKLSIYEQPSQLDDELAARLEAMRTRSDQGAAREYARYGGPEGGISVPFPDRSAEAAENAALRAAGFSDANIQAWREAMRPVPEAPEGFKPVEQYQHTPGERTFSRVADYEDPKSDFHSPDWKADNALGIAAKNPRSIPPFLAYTAVRAGKASSDGKLFMFPSDWKELGSRPEGTDQLDNLMTALFPDGDATKKAQALELIRVYNSNGHPIMFNLLADKVVDKVQPVQFYEKKPIKGVDGSVRGIRYTHGWPNSKTGGEGKTMYGAHPPSSTESSFVKDPFGGNPEDAAVLKEHFGSQSSRQDEFVDRKIEQEIFRTAPDEGASMSSHLVVVTPEDVETLVSGLTDPVQIEKALWRLGIRAELVDKHLQAAREGKTVLVKPGLLPENGELDVVYTGYEYNGQGLEPTKDNPWSITRTSPAASPRVRKEGEQASLGQSAKAVAEIEARNKANTERREARMAALPAGWEATPELSAEALAAARTTDRIGTLSSAKPGDFHGYSDWNELGMDPTMTGKLSADHLAGRYKPGEVSEDPIAGLDFSRSDRSGRTINATTGEITDEVDTSSYQPNRRQVTAEGLRDLELNDTVTGAEVDAVSPVSRQRVTLWPNAKGAPISAPRDQQLIYQWLTVKPESKQAKEMAEYLSYLLGPEDFKLLQAIKDPKSKSDRAMRKQFTDPLSEQGFKIRDALQRQDFEQIKDDSKLEFIRAQDRIYLTFQKLEKLLKPIQTKKPKARPPDGFDYVEDYDDIEYGWMPDMPEDLDFESLPKTAPTRAEVPTPVAADPKVVDTLRSKLAGYRNLYAKARSAGNEAAMKIYIKQGEEIKAKLKGLGVDALVAGSENELFDSYAKLLGKAGGKWQKVSREDSDDGE